MNVMWFSSVTILVLKALVALLCIAWAMTRSSCTARVRSLIVAGVLLIWMPSVANIFLQMYLVRTMSVEDFAQLWGFIGAVSGAIPVVGMAMLVFAALVDRHPIERDEDIITDETQSPNEALETGNPYQATRVRK